MTNGRAANQAPEVAFSPFRAPLRSRFALGLLSPKFDYNWINSVVSKETISVYVKLKITRLNKLDYAKHL